MTGDGGVSTPQQTSENRGASQRPLTPLMTLLFLALLVLFCLLAFVP